MTAGDPVTSTTEIPKTSRTRRRRRFGSRRPRDQRGAALVEFALIATPLFLILFGTIEFGWAFFQLNDIRHGSREGLRLVAVASDTNPGYIPASGDPAMDTNGKRLAQATCERMDQRDGVFVTIDLTELDGDGTFDVGDDVTVTAEKPLDQLTMLFDPVIGHVVLREVVTSRLEQDPPVDGSDVVDVEVTDWECQ
ncbi:MAG: TadE/TadG family type IV pilus assembly protein [Acidimicrobiia bacterium]